MLQRRSLSGRLIHFRGTGFGQGQGQGGRGDERDYHLERMPIYEYRCGSCRELFEALVYSSTKVVCPECGSEELEKQFSSFAVGGSAPDMPVNCDVARGGG